MPILYLHHWTFYIYLPNLCLLPHCSDDVNDVPIFSHRGGCHLGFVKEMTKRPSIKSEMFRKPFSKKKPKNLKHCPDGKASCSFPTDLQPKFPAASQDLDPKKEQFVVSEAPILPWNICWLVLWGFSPLFWERETHSLVLFSKLSQDKQRQLFPPSPLIFLEYFIYNFFCCAVLLSYRILHSHSGCFIFRS